MQGCKKKLHKRMEAYRPSQYTDLFSVSLLNPVGHQ